MNEKIGLQDLVALLAEKANITKKDAETLVKECFDIMEEGLVKDKLLKVRNLGTFKLVRVEDRESVDISTGEKVIIPAHYKVTFSPDVELAEKVNAPYASLGNVEIEGNEFPGKTEGEVEEETDDENDEEENDEENETEEKIAESGYFWKERGSTSSPDATSSLGAASLLNSPDKEKIAYLQEKAEGEQRTVENKREEVVAKPERFEDTQVEDEEEEYEDENEESVYSEQYDEDYRPGGVNRGLFWLFFIIASLLILFFAGRYFCPMLGYGGRQAIPDSVNVFSYSVNKPLGPDSLKVKADSAGLRAANISKQQVETLRATSPQTPTVTKAQTADNQPTKKFVNRQHTVRRGERLNTIALREFGHKAFWVYIYQENRNKISNPDLIEPGMVINIPPAAKYGIDKNNPQSVQKALELERKYKR